MKIKRIYFFRGIIGSFLIGVLINSVGVCAAEDISAGVQNAGSLSACNSYCETTSDIGGCYSQCTQEYSSDGGGAGSGTAYSCDPGYISDPSNPTSCIPDCKVGGTGERSGQYYSSYYDGCVGGGGSACLTNDDCGGGLSCNSSNVCEKNMWGSMFGATDGSGASASAESATNGALSGGANNAQSGSSTAIGNQGSGNVSSLPRSAYQTTGGTSSSIACSGETIGGICFPTNIGLPSTPVSKILSNLFSWIMGLFSVLCVMAFVISGIQYLTAAGDMELIKKAKNNAQWSIVGVLVGLSGVVIVKAIAAALQGTSMF